MMGCTKNKSIYLLFLLLLPVTACNRDQKSREKITELRNGKNAADYAVRLGEMSYLTGKKPDRNFSMPLLNDLISEGYFTEARYAIDHLTRIYGPDADLFYLEAVCFRNQHEYILAEGAIGKALGIDNTNTTYRTEEQNIADEAVRWASIDSLNQRILADCYDYASITRRAEKLLGMRQFDAAVFDADTVLHADSSNLEARFVRGMAHLLDKNFDKALPDFQFLAASPSSPQDTKQYTSYYQAAQTLRQNAGLIEKNPSDTDPYIAMARIFTGLSEFTSALSYLDQGLRINPSSNALTYAKLLVYLQSGNKVAARDIMYGLEAKGFKVDAKVKKMLGD